MIRCLNRHQTVSKIWMNFNPAGSWDKILITEINSVLQGHDAGSQNTAGKLQISYEPDGFSSETHKYAPDALQINALLW